jgi:hypothetical protein
MFRKKNRKNLAVIIVVVFAATVVAYPLIFSPEVEAPVMEERVDLTPEN